LNLSTDYSNRAIDRFMLALGKLRTTLRGNKSPAPADGTDAGRRIAAEGNTHQSGWTSSSTTSWRL
jgi:hypothetical protein